MTDPLGVLRVWGSKGQNSTFSEHSHNMVANILPADPSPPPLRPWGQNSTFSEEDHVAYRIKGKSRMQQLGSKYFARRPPSPPNPVGGVKWSKLKKIQNMIMLHIKLKGNLECNNMVANILPADHAQPSPPLVMLHFKLKGITNAATW